jgi:hypothetical protein
VVIKTDQRSLQYLGSQRLLEGIQHKLMLKLLEFDYTIEYKKEKENTVADALSRKYQGDENSQEETFTEQTEHCNTLSLLVPTWMEEVIAAYQHDEKCQKLIQQLAIDKDSNLPHSLQTSILRYKGKNLHWQFK